MAHLNQPRFHITICLLHTTNYDFGHKFSAAFMREPRAHQYLTRIYSEAKQKAFTNECEMVGNGILDNITRNLTAICFEFNVTVGTFRSDCMLFNIAFY